MFIRRWILGCFWVVVLFVGMIQAEEPKQKKTIAATAGCSCEQFRNDFRTPLIPPAREQDLKCSEQPEEAQILRAMSPAIRLAGFYQESRDDTAIVTERLIDKLDPPRFYPLVGPAQLHHCNWKCEVYYTETITGSYPFSFRCSWVRKQVVYIDTDHFHIYSKDEERAK